MVKNVKNMSPEKIRILSASTSLPDTEADQYGDALFEEGKISQALLFYERSRTEEKIARVKTHAIEQGDAFLLYGLERLSPDSVEENDWRQAGENALQRKQYIFARDCFERAEEPTRAQEAHEAYLKVFPSPPTDDAPSDPE